MRKIHNDEPTLADALERAERVRDVAEVIAHGTPPQVFGVHGDWGTGKTSFLHQLQYVLVGDCPQQTEAELGGDLSALGKKGRYEDRVTVVWFEAWRYQNEKAPIVALLQEIRAQLPWYSKALEESKKLGEVTIRGALLSLEDLTKRIGIQASKIEQAGRQWEDENLATRLPSHMIRQHLEEALKTLLRPEGSKAHRRLVVLVDDLDRCESETAYQLLEGIKIYLNLPSCVFVLGMNQDVIENAVAKHVPETPEDTPGHRRATAKRYLEKLCQNIWHLPLVREPAALLRHYLSDRGVPDEIAEVVAAYRCLPPIPRKIKGYANVLLRFDRQLTVWSKAGRATDEPTRWAELAVAYTYLYHFHHAVYRLLWRDGAEFWTELLNWCNGQESRADGQLAHLQRLEDAEARTQPTGIDERSPTPEASGFVTVFHDPAADNVLHIERLVRQIERLRSEEERKYLLD